MTDKSKYPLLATINSPADLRALPEEKVQQVSDELRAFLLESVATTGGHLAGGLGTVELTVALHYIFNTPDDRIVWDVGHQAYPHKILTGRRDQMDRIRMKDGLAGFPKRGESEYDTFGVGHSSTSISAALGMSIGAKLTNSNRQSIAVIGDGAMTAGQAFEALEHAGDIKADMLVILNDNEMSISPNVGALSNYLAKTLSGRFYSSVRSGSKRVLEKVPPVRELAKRAEEHVKGMVVPGTVFEELGFTYYGPVDGHDLTTLTTMLNNLKSISGPKLLHVITKKGKGYEPAEQNPVQYHAVTPFSPSEGVKKKPSSSQSPTYTQVFGKWLCDIAGQDARAVGITPAMREGSGLVDFSLEYPDRYFDVAIAEQHSVTVAAGMACEGAKPILAIYSTFLQRGYDQLIHDVAIQNLDVTFAIDRAGVVGPDGPTHAGSFDISFMRCVPNMVILCPADENECRQMLYTGYQYEGPAAIRYPRGKGPGVPVQTPMQAIPIGKGEIRRRGKSVAILAFGSVFTAALAVADKIDATCANMRFAKPLDEELILDIAKSHEHIITVEENAVIGGAGEGIRDVLQSHGLHHIVKTIGLPDRFVEHGSREELIAECLLDEPGLTATITDWLASQTGSENSSKAAS